MTDLLITNANGVATVTINRPQQRNAITNAMWCAIPDLCRTLGQDAEVRVVVWRGAGDEAFSAGGDISEFAWQRSNRSQAAEYNQRVDAALHSILTLDKPTIALVRGYCMGGGFMLACHCDLRVAAGNARFAMPVGKLGNVISYPEMKRFVDLIGPSATADLLLTGRTVDAVEAHVIGLCNQVYPSEIIERGLTELTQRMVRFSPLSQRSHKQMLQVLLRKPDLQQLTADELELQSHAFDSADYAEGTRAFLEKREPRFGGQ